MQLLNFTIILFLRYQANFYSLLNDQNEHYDIQIKWLMDTMEQAEKNQEMVNIFNTE